MDKQRQEKLVVLNGEMVTLPDNALVMHGIMVHREYYFNHLTFDCSPWSTDLKLVGRRGTLVFIPDAGQDGN